MNVYDFDGTLYNGDSTVDFFFFALKSKPALLLYVPKQLLGFALYGIKRIDKTTLKSYFFSFLPAVNTQDLVNAFWETNRRKIYPWYLNQQRPDDIVISASPDFLLRPICERLGISNLIASEVDVKTGNFSGKNCRGHEKVNRLYSEYGNVHIENFYSDSRSDSPLAEIADEAFFVKNGRIAQWE